MHVACPGNGLQVRHSLCQVPPEAGTASEVSQMGRGEKEPVWRQSGSIWKNQVSQVLKESAEVHNPSCLDDLGRRVTCWLTVHCIHSQRNHLPGALRVFASAHKLHGDVRFHFPAGLCTCFTVPKPLPIWEVTTVSMYWINQPPCLD